MIEVELVYDIDCPNVPATREQLRSALDLAGLPPEWQEWDRSAETSPEHVRLFGSPTILVDGQDVAGAPPSGEANCCRVYSNENGVLAGTPSVETILAAIHGSRSESGPVGPNQGTIRRGFAALPAIGVVMIPGLSCPACWPAYAGLLSSLGIGFMDFTPYLLPVTLVFLSLAVFSLGYRAGTRRGRLPLLLGIAGAIALVLGRFVIPTSAGTYSGISLLVIASIWNSWPLNKGKSETCPDCDKHPEIEEEIA
jgi:hypothetical protein